MKLYHWNGLSCAGTNLGQRLRRWPKYVPTQFRTSLKSRTDCLFSGPNYLAVMGVHLSRKWGLPFTGMGRLALYITLLPGPPGDACPCESHKQSARQSSKPDIPCDLRTRYTCAGHGSRRCHFCLKKYCSISLCICSCCIIMPSPPPPFLP